MTDAAFYCMSLLTDDVSKIYSIKIRPILRVLRGTHLTTLKNHRMCRFLYRRLVVVEGIV
jgi:hypothetical protein